MEDVNEYSRGAAEGEMERRMGGGSDAMSAGWLQEISQSYRREESILPKQGTGTEI